MDGTAGLVCLHEPSSGRSDILYRPLIDLATSLKGRRSLGRNSVEIFYNPAT
jgi:hypothetical protein